MESDSGRMPNVVVYLYLLNTVFRRGRASKDRDEGKGVLLNLPLRWSHFRLDPGCWEHDVLLPPQTGRAEEGTVHAGVGLPAAAALPMPLTPMTGGFTRLLGKASRPDQLRSQALLCSWVT